VRQEDGARPGRGARVLSASVDVSGHVAIHGGGEATSQLLQRHPGLLGYARTLLSGAATSVRFFWQDPELGWLAAAIGRTASEGQVELTLTPSALPKGLTPRELDVLSLLVGGLSNRQIADRLCTSVRTVSTHVEHILAKLGHSSRAGAAAVAAERGWIRLPVPGGGAGLRDLVVGGLHVGSVAAGQPAARFPSPAADSRRAAGIRRRTLVIGQALPLSGLAAADGLEMLNGSSLAVAEINSRGGVGGRRIEQMVVDTDIFSVTGVQRAFDKLVGAGVDAIASGYVFMEDAAREVAASYGAPYLHSMTSESQARMVSDNHERYGHIFQVCPTERHYGSGFIRFLSELVASGRWHPHRPAVAFVESALPSGQMVNDLTVAAAVRAGWAIERVDTVPATGADWPQVADGLEHADPAAVMVTQFLAADLAGFQREIARRAPHVLVYAVYAPSVPEFLELAGPSAEGLCWATVTGTYSDSIGQRFRESYEHAWGRHPGRSHAGIAYDEIYLLAGAWASVSDPSDHGAVSDELRRMRYRGVNGAYYLDNPGQSGLLFPDVTPDPSLAQAHLVFQIQHGEHRIISPAPYAEAAFSWPAETVATGGAR
jgi:branched-chain amino acid transport system substrate-binding protein